MLSTQVRSTTNRLCAAGFPISQVGRQALACSGRPTAAAKNVRRGATQRGACARSAIMRIRSKRCLRALTQLHLPVDAFSLQTPDPDGAAFRGRLLIRRFPLRRESAIDMGNGCANGHPLLPFPAYLTSSRLLSYLLFSSAVDGGVAFFREIALKALRQGPDPGLQRTQRLREVRALRLKARAAMSAL